MSEGATRAPLLMTVPEVADLLRTSPKAVYWMVGRGQVPGVTRIGRRVLIRRDRLLKWLNDCGEDGARGRRAADQA